jgi:uncharacterized protein (DUF2147 family)
MILRQLSSPSLLAGFLGLLMAAMPQAVFADISPYGTWTMGKVTVKVTDCGGSLCARIVALAEPISKIDGKPKVDRENPDQSQRKRPLIGLTVMSGMTPSGDNLWTGRIYNPDDGNTYSGTIRMAGATMKVKGCVASILCKTNVFMKVN